MLDQLDLGAGEVDGGRHQVEPRTGVETTACWSVQRPVSRS
jgi:hypothetical protein